MIFYIRCNCLLDETLLNPTQRLESSIDLEISTKGPHTSVQGEHFYVCQVEYIERKHVEDLTNVGVIIQSVVLVLYLLLIWFTPSNLWCIKKTMMKHQQNLDLPLFNYGYWRCMFVDSSSKYLNPPFVSQVWHSQK
jgi:hypothetical protein